MKLLLAISSYAILNLLLLLRFWNEILGWVNAALLALSLAAALILSKTSRRKNAAETLTVKRVEDQGFAAASYLVSYVLPISFIEGDEWQDIAAFAVLYLLLIYVSMRSGISQINPTLFIFGNRISEVRVGNDRKYIVISKRPLEAGSTKRFAVISTGLLQALEKKEKHNVV